MKKPGSTSSYTPERNMALLAAFRHELRVRRLINLDDIFAHIATNVSAPRFYVSEERAVLIIKHHLRYGKWLLRSELRRSMFERIESIALRYISEGEAATLVDAIYLAVNDPAPSFYLTPRTVRTYLYTS